MKDKQASEKPEEKSLNEKEMPFLDHLEELRQRIIKSLLAVIVLSIVSYIFIDQIFELLVKPYRDAIHIASSELAGTATADPTSKLVFLGPTGGFMVYLKLAVTMGLILSLPFVFYQVWRFIAPGLLKNERRYTPVVVLATVFCFTAGAMFCYFVVLRFGLGFLLSFQSASLVAMISIEEYFGFVTALIFIFGIVFEMPVLAFFLSRIGLLTPEFLRQYRRYSIVVIFIAAAVITPSVDAFTQILLAAPLLVLYEISIWVSKLAMPAAMRDSLREATAN